MVKNQEKKWKSHGLDVGWLKAVLPVMMVARSSWIVQLWIIQYSSAAMLVTFEMIPLLTRFILDVFS
jgi:hypothetical protein